ncbi:MAG TPA: hypothetical protein VLM05_01280 [Mycobacteriales bacterium]|nr:hypothetical protein [Mycobacteriales bacterium]
MIRRLAIAAAALAAGLAATVVAAVPASAADVFTPAVTVVAPPCTPAGSSDAAFGAGTVRGFASFDNCSHAIYYFEGGTQGYTRILTPYRGDVLGVDTDETATYLVYLMTDAAGNASGIGVTKRMHGGGFAATRVLSTHVGAVRPTADVSAEGGRWWAVWTEQVGETEFAPQQLFQAKTFGTGADHQQITFTGPGVDNTEPSISLDAVGAVMTWTRQTAPAQPGPADLWVATNANTAWSSRVFSADGTFNGASDVKRIGGVTFMAFVRDGRIVESENTPGTFVSHAFLQPGFGPKVGATAGSQFVAWSTGSRIFYARGNNGAQSFVGQFASDLGTTLAGLVAANGKATVLVRSSNRIYSITSSS